MKEIVNPGKVIKVDGRLYYRVQCQCPVCLERGNHPEMRYWKHGDCGGDLYLGGNAYFICDNCGDTGHIMEYGYRCRIHSESTSSEYVGVNDPRYVAAAISTAGQLMCGEAELDFLEEFIITLKKYKKSH